MTTPPDLAARLLAGLNGDPDQRAATTLLIRAVHGVWLTKLSGWDQYLSHTHDPRRPHGLYVDWAQLRSDLAQDSAAREQFRTWAESHKGRQASDQQYDAAHAATVPPRPWHGASSGELVVLRIATELAPGGLIGEGIHRLDPPNRHALQDAVDDLLTGEYHEPDPPPGLPNPPAPDEAASRGSR